MERENILKAAGYKVLNMWGCEWEQLKKEKMTRVERKLVEEKLRWSISIFEMQCLGVGLRLSNPILNVMKINRSFITMLLVSTPPAMH